MTTSKGKVDPDELRRAAQDLVNLVTSPEFMKQVQAVSQAEESSRLTEAAKRLTPTALRQAGLQLPKYTRISSRYFEEGRRARELKFIDQQASEDILQLLNKARPGILDRIDETDPDLLDKLNEISDGGESMGACICAGGSIGGVGGCAGGG